MISNLNFKFYSINYFEYFTISVYYELNSILFKYKYNLLVVVILILKILNLLVSTIWSIIKLFIPHVYLFSTYSFANDISNHYPIFLSFNKNLSFQMVLINLRKLLNGQDIFYYTQNTNILFYNYFSSFSK